MLLAVTTGPGLRKIVELPCTDCKHLYMRHGPISEQRPTCILRCRCHGWEVYSPSGRVEPEHEAAMRDMTCGAFEAKGPTHETA